MKKYFYSFVIVFFIIFNTFSAYAEEEVWVCPQCNSSVSGKFCNICGTKRPSAEWVCPECGSTESGNFCSNCGTARPDETNSRNYSEDSEIKNKELDEKDQRITESNNTVYIAAQDSLNEEGIHQYKYYIEDCTWNQAFYKAKEKGGYLVHINSNEEYKYILSEIEKRELNNIKFLIGARRDLDSLQYKWVDINNELYGDVINSPKCWAATKWLTGEPSFMDGNTVESYLSIFYYSGVGAWVWNDIPDDISLYYSGAMGYIVEFDESIQVIDHQETNEAPSYYMEIIDQYREAISIYPESQDMGLINQLYSNVNSMLILNQYSWPESYKLYYAYYDIDGNGTNELLIGQGNPDGTGIACCDVFSTDEISAIRFFADRSLGYRSTLTIYSDGTMNLKGSNGAYDGIEECWIIGDDGYTPLMILQYNIHYGENNFISYSDVIGEMSPEDYTNSLLYKSEIELSNWKMI